jgi:hypothetical protein
MVFSCNEMIVVHATKPYYVRSLCQIKTLRRHALEPIESKTRLLLFSFVERLALKGEAGAELVAGLVQLLGIERATNTESQTGVDLGVVGEGRNAEVVDLGL